MNQLENNRNYIVLLPFGINNNYVRFVDGLYNSLKSLNLNKIIPTEEEFRFRVASFIQDLIDTADTSDFNEIIMNLERQSQDRSKIDIVIFYDPKNGESFAEIIELKRAGKDKHVDMKKSASERYYSEIRSGSIAQDLYKLVNRFSQSEFIHRAISTQTKRLDEETPITNGLFLWLSPTQKKGKTFSEDFKKEILYGGVDFWQNEGKKIIKEKNGVEINIFQPPKSFDNIKSLNQETPEFFEYVFFKRKDSSSTNL